MCLPSSTSSSKAKLAWWCSLGMPIFEYVSNWFTKAPILDSYPQRKRKRERGEGKFMGKQSHFHEILDVPEVLLPRSTFTEGGPINSAPNSIALRSNCIETFLVLFKKSGESSNPLSKEALNWWNMFPFRVLHGDNCSPGDLDITSFIRGP